MRRPSRDQFGTLGMAVGGSVGVALGLLAGVSAWVLLLFGVAALVGVTGLVGPPTVRLGGYAAGAALALVAGVVRLVRSEGVELLAVLLLALGTVFALRGAQQVWFPPDSEP